MSSVMMDRWSIENVIEYLGGNVEEYKKNVDSVIFDQRCYSSHYNRESTAIMGCWENFLTALILWDEIWSFNRKFIYDWKKSLKDKSLASDFENIIYQIEPDAINDSLLKVYFELVDGIRVGGCHQNRDRTLGYLFISNSLGVPLLAHPERDMHRFSDISRQLFTRFDILNMIDKELIDYYVKVNSEIGREVLKFDEN